MGMKKTLGMIIDTEKQDAVVWFIIDSLNYLLIYGFASK